MLRKHSLAYQTLAIKKFVVLTCSLLHGA